MAFTDCPRCGAEYGVRLTDDVEPSCLMCGWANYVVPLPVAQNRARSVEDRLLKPRGYVVPYYGGTAGLKAIQVRVVILRARNHPIPICPYDSTEMTSAGYTYTRKGQRGNHSQYQCTSGHRIALKHDSLGEAIGWI